MRYLVNKNQATYEDYIGDLNVLGALVSELETAELEGKTWEYVLAEYLEEYPDNKLFSIKQKILEKMKRVLFLTIFMILLVSCGSSSTPTLTVSSDLRQITEEEYKDLHKGIYRSQYNIYIYEITVKGKDLENMDSVEIEMPEMREIRERFEELEEDVYISFHGSSQPVTTDNFFYYEYTMYLNAQGLEFDALLR